MTKFAARIALVCALVGIAASVAAGYVHYHLLFDPHYTSFCDMSGKMSCTQAYQSRFSTVWGIPVSIFAGIWFVGAALLSVGGLAGQDEIRESVPAYLFAMSTPALAAVLYLLYASVFILHVYCPMCLFMDAAVIGLFLTSGAATSVPMTTLPRRAVRDLRLLVTNPFAIAVTVLFFAGAVSTLAFFPREGVAAGAGESAALPATTAAQQSELERFMATAPRIPLIVPRDGAKVLIVKFNDFQCPACGHSYLTYKPILAKYEAKYPGAV